jgi:hypothetical protein
MSIKSKSNRAIGVEDFMTKKFVTLDFDGKWRDTLGEPEANFRMLVYGHPGNGKTEFCMQFAKYLCKFDKKVYFNSFEQGISKSLQTCLERNKMREVKGKIIFGNKESLEEMTSRLSNRNSPHFVFIDSRDYMNLTKEHYISLVERFPHKSFIIICWEDAQKPKGTHAKAIEYMADIKVHVKRFKAYPRSRFEGNQVYTIWDKPTNTDAPTKPQAPTLFDQPIPSPQTTTS